MAFRYQVSAGLTSLSPTFVDPVLANLGISREVDQQPRLLEIVTKEFEKEASRYASTPLRGIYFIERRFPSEEPVRPGELRDMRWLDL